MAHDNGPSMEVPMEVPMFNEAIAAERNCMRRTKNKARVFVAVYYIEDQMAAGLPHTDPSLKEHFHYGIYVESKDRTFSTAYDINPVRKLMVKNVKDLNMTSQNEPVRAESSGAKITDGPNTICDEIPIEEILGGNGSYHPNLHVPLPSTVGQTSGEDALENEGKWVGKGKSVEREPDYYGISGQNDRDSGHKPLPGKDRGEIVSPGVFPGKKCIEWGYFCGENKTRAKHVCLGMWMIGKLPSPVTQNMVGHLLGQLPVLSAGDPFEDWEGLKSACTWWTKQAIRVLQDAGWADEFDVDEFTTYAFAYAVEWKLRRIHKMLLISDSQWEPERKRYVNRKFP